MKRRWLSAAPWRAVTDSAVVIGLLAIPLFIAKAGVSTPVLHSGLALLAPVGALVFAIRLRPDPDETNVTAYELACASAFNLVSGALALSAMTIIKRGTAAELPTIALALSGGAAALIIRGAIHSARRWQDQCRRSYSWRLTQAKLSVVALLALPITFGGALWLIKPAFVPAGFDWSFASIITMVVANVIPGLAKTAGISAGATLLALVLALPLARISARRNTRRIETLVRDTIALNDGERPFPETDDEEDELAQLRGDIHKLAAELDRVTTDLRIEQVTNKRLFDSQHALLDGLANEIKEPIAAISRGLDELNNDRHLDNLREETRRLQVLVEDIFTLARVEVDQLALRPEPVDVLDIINGLVESIRPQAWERARVEMITDIESGLPLALADQDRMTQVMRNLLQTALRRTEPGGIVVVSAKTNGQALIIEVRDTGKGIEPEELPYVWDRYYRPKESHAEGTGLGLTLVKELVEAMHGEVQAKSTPGEGSCFTIRLPHAG
ncbi:MAG: HAMP domain-containing histidine kinase [Anaerolineae bacterium]|nr:HAMP domain-containing histidine kinase [Anaerolineae bacterium]